MDMTVNTEYLQKTGHIARELRAAAREKGGHSRDKKKLQLVLHALDRLLHQVHVLAAVAQRVLPARVEVDDPVHWHLTCGKLPVPDHK